MKVFAYSYRHFDEEPFFEKYCKELGIELGYTEKDPTLETAELARGYEYISILLTRVDAQLVEKFASMGVKVISNRLIGTDHVDVKRAKELGMTVTYAPYSSACVADYAVMLMLTLNRKVHRAYWRTRDGNFSLHGLMGFDMYGKTAGIVGTGRIARELIRILKGFGMEVVANDLFPDPQYAAEAGIAYVPLDELYARADIVSLHCPLTDRTRYMIGDAAISRMKPGVILINTGRGQLIHTEALIDGLKEKKIGAAGLDVYEEEAGYFYEDTSDRIMDDDVLARLLSFNNVIVTSHQGFFTREAVDNIARTTMQNIKDFSECRRLENEVRAEPENAVGQL